MVTLERRPPPTIYPYELAWILPRIAIPVVMLVALTVTAFGAGIHLPAYHGEEGEQAREDPDAFPRARVDGTDRRVNRPFWPPPHTGSSA